MCLVFTWLVEEVKGRREATSEELRLLVPQLPLVPNLRSPSFRHSLEGRGTSAGAFRNQRVIVCPGEQEEPSEGVSYRQQESHLCQQMKLASVSPGGQESAAAAWFQEEPASCSAAQPGPGPNLPVSRTSRRNLRGGANEPVCFSSDQQQQFTSSEHPKLPDPARIRSRIPPNMPKLFIPSTVTKFPPEITVTPPTPTLLSPKGSISEETKQKLKVRTPPHLCPLTPPASI